jgi:hypothetical protein
MVAHLGAAHQAQVVEGRHRAGNLFLEGGGEGPGRPGLCGHVRPDGHGTHHADPANLGISDLVLPGQAHLGFFLLAVLAFLFSKVVHSLERLFVHFKHRGHSILRDEAGTGVHLALEIVRNSPRVLSSLFVHLLAISTAHLQWCLVFFFFFFWVKLSIKVQPKTNSFFLLRDLRAATFSLTMPLRPAVALAAVERDDLSPLGDDLLGFRFAHGRNIFHICAAHNSLHVLSQALLQAKARAAAASGGGGGAAAAAAAAAAEAEQLELGGGEDNFAVLRFAEATDDQGRTPLHRAALHGCEDAARLLLDALVDVDAADGGGRSPLMLAASQGHERVVQLLVSRGARVDGRDKEGLAAIHYAADADRAELVALLASLGADLLVASRDGRGVEDFGSAATRSSVEILLQDAEDGVRGTCAGRACEVPILGRGLLAILASFLFAYNLTMLPFIGSFSSEHTQWFTVSAVAVAGLSLSLLLRLSFAKQPWRLPAGLDPALCGALSCSASVCVLFGVWYIGRLDMTDASPNTRHFGPVVVGGHFVYVVLSSLAAALVSGTSKMNVVAAVIDCVGAVNAAVLFVLLSRAGERDPAVELLLALMAARLCLGLGVGTTLNLRAAVALSAPELRSSRARGVNSGFRRLSVLLGAGSALAVEGGTLAALYILGIVGGGATAAAPSGSGARRTVGHAGSWVLAFTILSLFKRVVIDPIVFLANDGPEGLPPVTHSAHESFDGGDGDGEGDGEGDDAVPAETRMTVLKDGMPAIAIQEERSEEEDEAPFFT